MDPLLEQFLSESRDGLQQIATQLMRLESQPADGAVMSELFRLVHTLKGNSGLFDFPEMSRVLHAGEDLMDAVRNGKVAFRPETADCLLQAMDFVSQLCNEIEEQGGCKSEHAEPAAALSRALRQLIASDDAKPVLADVQVAAAVPDSIRSANFDAAAIPEEIRMQAYRDLHAGGCVHFLCYQPDEQCFFQGVDPLHQAMSTPDVLWGQVRATEPWAELETLDAYRCVLQFRFLSSASRDVLDTCFRYMADEVEIQALSALDLIQPVGAENDGGLQHDFIAEAECLLLADDRNGLARAARSMLELSSPALRLSSVLRWLLLVLELEPEQHSLQQALIASLKDMQPLHLMMHTAPAISLASDSGADCAYGLHPLLATHMSADVAAAVLHLLEIQQKILRTGGWHPGRVRAVIASLLACIRHGDHATALSALQLAQQQAESASDTQPLLAWMASHCFAGEPPVAVPQMALPPAAVPLAEADPDIRFCRRAEDHVTISKSLKVDQEKIDRLVNLIGEMVVSKNALPYLASRAEEVYGSRDMAREIKAQYVVINRIAEEMQDAILQVRMMPVSFIFQRFPRLVRDISRRLGKEVNLVLEGEETEADKNIIESLSDPLLHIVRNSLDHGFEAVAERLAKGKPAKGTLTIRAAQEADRVVIDITDDGRGIDPQAVKLKAYQKGIIDEATLERISDQGAINLVFAAGFSTAEVISDLSGRGVGMDVVRSAIEKVNGSVVLSSEMGKGTRLRLSLPLSMAISNVMVVESDGQIFGVPMDAVVETVRVPSQDIRTIKRTLATVLRGRIVPLKPMNQLLGLAAPPLANDDDQLAVLLVRLGDDVLGLLVDDFRETVSVIVKPMTSILSGLAMYSGSALMGDGSVLMVLNVKEML